MYVAMHFPLTKLTSLGLVVTWNCIIEVPKVFRLYGTNKKINIKPLYADSLLVSKTGLIKDIIPWH